MNRSPKAHANLTSAISTQKTLKLLQAQTIPLFLNGEQVNQDSSAVPKAHHLPLQLGDFQLKPPHFGLSIIPSLTYHATLPLEGVTMLSIPLGVAIYS